MLKQLGEAGVDRPLVSGVHLDVVGNRAFLVDGAVGIREHRSSGVAETSSRRFQLLERCQPGTESRKIVFARARLAGAPFVLDPRARELRLASGARNTRRVESLLRTLQRV